jgi:hypothetical protein
MTGWWDGDEVPDEVPDSAKLAAMAGFEPNAAHDPGGALVLPSGDAVALADLTGLVPSAAHDHALGAVAESDSVTERLVAARRELREYEDRDAVAERRANVHQVHADAEIEHAKARRDDPLPVTGEWSYHVPDGPVTAGPVPGYTDPDLARAQALEYDPLHGAILGAAKRYRPQPVKQPAKRRTARQPARQARGACGVVGCECGPEPYGWG